MTADHAELLIEFNNFELHIAVKIKFKCLHLFICATCIVLTDFD